jgi:hypothetical protein
MKLKQLPIAILISGLILLFEFKVLPYLINEIKLWNKKSFQPVQEVEIYKSRLVTTLKQNKKEILVGPKSRPEINGIEVIINESGYPLKIIFSTRQSPQNQLASLQLILKEAKIEEKLAEGVPPKLIDLTGDKPYVSF